MMLCVLIVSCSNGGSGGGNATPAEERLDVYDFDLSNLNSDPLQIYYTSLKETVYVKEGSTGLFDGTYTPATGAYTINELSTLNISATLWDDLSNGLFVEVKEAVSSTGGQYPDEGVLRIIDKGANLITITLSSKSVVLAHNTDAPVSLSWNAFGDLVGAESAETWKQQASLAWSVMALFVSQIDMSMDCTVTIQDKKQTISASPEHKLTIACDELTGQGKGIRSLQWKDTRSNGEIGPGDEFLLTLGSCWVNDLNSKVDALLFGPVHLLKYVEEKEKSGNTLVLTKTGFTISYDSLTMTRTVENSSGTPTIDTEGSIILYGGFTLLFSDPAS